MIEQLIFFVIFLFAISKVPDKRRVTFIEEWFGYFAPLGFCTASAYWLELNTTTRMSFFLAITIWAKIYQLIFKFNPKK